MSLELLVGHGSRAAEEKHFFDSHLAPFYRIQQLILATVPEQKGRKPPSIIAEDNIQLLFDMQRKCGVKPCNDSRSHGNGNKFKHNVLKVPQPKDNSQLQRFALGLTLLRLPFRRRCCCRFLTTCNSSLLKGENLYYKSEI